MLGSHGRRYLIIVLMAITISTAWTLIVWIWRERAVRLLEIQGPDVLFNAARGERVLSISVAPERDLTTLGFRFRSLMSEDLAWATNLSVVGSVDELLASCRPVAERMRLFQELGAGPFISIHRVPVTNSKDERLVLVDFGRIYSALFSQGHENESISCFAFLINSTNNLVGYFEGYSDYIVARPSKLTYLNRENLLKLVRVQAGEENLEYLSEPSGDEPSIRDDLPHWGEISLSDAKKDSPYGVTLVMKEGKISSGTLLLTAETYAEGRWVEDASGYWVVQTAAM